MDTMENPMPDRGRHKRPTNIKNTRPDTPKTDQAFLALSVLAIIVVAMVILPVWSEKKSTHYVTTHHADNEAAERIESEQKGCVAILAASHELYGTYANP
jgi:hypothetical protein